MLCTGSGCDLHCIGSLFSNGQLLCAWFLLPEAVPFSRKFPLPLGGMGQEMKWLDEPMTNGVPPQSQARYEVILNDEQKTKFLLNDERDPSDP